MSECRGSGERIDGPYYKNEFHRIRVTCPECKREYKATFRVLGRRGDGMYESRVPNHPRLRGHA